MTNELKFRAWDEGNRVMHHSFQWFSSGNEGNDWICFASLEEPQIADKQQVVLNNPYFRQQLKIMQYTGIKDKTGAEIYEGDILVDHMNPHQYVVKIGYCKLHAFTGVYADVNNGFIQSTLNNDDGKNFNSSIRVIGNIYEKK